MSWLAPSINALAPTPRTRSVAVGAVETSNLALLGLAAAAVGVIAAVRLYKVDSSGTRHEIVRPRTTDEVWEAFAKDGAIKNRRRRAAQQKRLNAWQAAKQKESEGDRLARFEKLAAFEKSFGAKERE